MGAELRREQAGRERRHHAGRIRNAGAERDQREHVEIAGDDRLRAAHEERPSGPQHHWGRERELDQGRGRGPHQSVSAGEVGAHVEDDDRHGQQEPDPEPARHVRELGIGTRLRRYELRLQRHAADRARAGSDLPDLRMHRAGVDRALGYRFLLAAGAGEMALRVGDEFLPAPGGAEVIRTTLVLGPMRGRVRVDRHAADRIDRAAVRRRRRPGVIGAAVMRALRAMMRVIRSMVAHDLPFTPIPRRGI